MDKRMKTNMSYRVLGSGSGDFINRLVMTITRVNFQSAKSLDHPSRGFIMKVDARIMVFIRGKP